MKMILYFAICAAILAVDILSKYFAVSGLKPIETIPLLEGIFHLTYVENRGAEFGMLQNSRALLILVTVLVLAALFFVAKRYKGKSKTLNVSVAFISAGALGNLIDRVFRGFVVDFFDFRLINFPVFNVADIFVCIGALLFGIFIIFFEEDKKECEDNEI